MPNYKVVVSKDNKRYNIALKAENEAVARDRVHKEGYSILTLQEISDSENIGNTFIFEGYKGGELKHGKIAGNDIFKAYLKLKDLGYTIDYIYSEADKDVPLERKRKILQELEEEFVIYNAKNKIKTTQIKQGEVAEKGREKIDLSNFYISKELEETNKLIDEVLTKLEKLFTGNSIKNVSEEKKEKLRQIYNEIIKIKKSTNISKLKEVGELALQKLGEIELEDVELNKNEENRGLLNETNKLLKELGSKTHFVEKEKTLTYQLESLKDTVFKNLSTQTKEEKKEEVDKGSHLYLKNSLYLSKYKEKLAENTKFIWSNLFKLLKDENLREDTFLKRSVIKQNIVLFNARLEGVSVSYTFIKKGIPKLFNNIVDFFRAFLYPIFIVIFVYSLVFILYFNFHNILGTIDFNYSSLALFLFLIIFYILLNFSRNIISLLLNFAIFSFIVIFGVINF